MASVDLDLEDYELRARAMQGIGPVESQTPLISIPVPLGISSDSSIESVGKKIALPQHRPSLASPKHIMYDLMSMHMETERLTARSASQVEAEITQGMADIDRLNAEKDEAIKNEAEAVKSRATWSTLAHIAEYVTGVAAVILGAAVYSVAAIPGALLVLSGVIGTGNRIAHDTHILKTFVEWSTKSVEQQKKMTQFIETSAFFLQMGLGLAGGIGAWRTGAFAAMNAASGTDMVQKVASVITPASGILASGATVGAKVYEKRVSDISAHLKEIDCDMTFENHNITKEMGKINRSIENTESQVGVIRRAIKNLEVSQD